jgi:uncharacterized protein (TIRG00374 family)
LVVGALLAVVGVDRIGAALATADPRLFAVVAVFGLAQVTVWGLALRTVLGTLSVPVTRRTGVLLYAAATFANNVTPFGQAGGEPVTAFAITRATDSRYETSLAAIATVDAAHVVTSLGVATVGAVVTLATVTRSGRLATLGAAAIGLAVAVAVVGGLLVRYRAGVVETLAAPAVRAERRLLAALPDRLRQVASEARTRVGDFVADLRAVADDRSALAAAMGFSATGWLCEVGALGVALAGLGLTPPVTTLLVLVPAAKVAGFAPLPGGFGSIEATLVGLLTATTAADAGLATAAVLVSRTATYWIPTILGGGVSLWLGVRGE